MRLTNYIIVFSVLFLGIGLWLAYAVTFNTKTGITDNEYSTFLTTAATDAVASTKQENAHNGNIFGTEKARERAVNTFYTSLGYSFNNLHTSLAEVMKTAIPVILLIDNDGYYIVYNSAFDVYGNTERNTEAAAIDSKAYVSPQSISPLCTWAKDYAPFTVRFYLNNMVQIMSDSGYILTGSKEEVAKQLLEYTNKGFIPAGDYMTQVIFDEDGIGYTMVEFLRNDDLYNSERNSVITNKIAEETEYYVNNQNHRNQQTLDRTYRFTFPMVNDADWHRLLKNPTVLSFMQGAQVFGGHSFSNIYAYAGGEVIKDRQYCITADGYYHLLTEDSKYHTVQKVVDYVPTTVRNGLTTHTVYKKDEYWMFDGERVVQIYNSARACALEGAIPDECAINLNR